jgi:heptosyltransferase-2
MAQSLFKAIMRNDPEATIDVLAPAWTGALVERMPEVIALVAADFTHGKLSLGQRFRLGKKLRNSHYSHAIVLPNSLKSALVPAIAKIQTRTGFIGEQRWGLLNDMRKLDKNSLPMTVQRFVALGLDKQAPTPEIQSIAPPMLKVDADTVSKVIDRNGLSLDKQVLVLCPGAEFGESKKWPARYYAQVAQHYLDINWQVWLMGSDKDIPDCLLIDQATAARCHILAGKTSLPEAIDLISCADLAVSNDSGLMHIAAALQIPLVAIYGSTDPGHTPPLSNNHTIARLDLDCSPCFKRQCPLHHLDCLNQLDSEAVIEHASQLVLET